MGASPVGIGLIVDRKFDWANETMYSMLSYEKDILLGKSTRMLYPNQRVYEAIGRQIFAGITESETNHLETIWVRNDDMKPLKVQLIIKEALKLIRSLLPSTIDIIQEISNNLGLIMPNMTGEQLASKILKLRPDMPIILCTGFSEKMSVKKAASLGIKGLLMKPVGIGDLSTTIRKVLHKSL